MGGPVQLVRLSADKKDVNRLDLRKNSSMAGNVVLAVLDFDEKAIQKA